MPFYPSFFLIKLLALRTLEERLPPEAPKEEFGRMIFEKKSSLGDRTVNAIGTAAVARGGEAWRRNA